MASNIPSLGLLIAAGSLSVIAVVTLHAARGERLALRHVSLDLPGPPSKVIPYDLDGDGRMDLAVVVAYTEIEEIGEDRIENMVQISTVIPAVFDRREVHAYLGTESGEYVSAGAPLELPPSTLHMEPGPPGAGIIALTDEGLSRLRFEAGGEGPSLQLEPVLRDPPILAGTRSFYASLELVHDLNGDGIDDVLLPSRNGLAVYLGSATGLGPEPSDRIEIPEREQRFPDRVGRWYTMPDIRDVNGDGVADLLFSERFCDDSPAPLHVLLGSREGVFRAMRRETLDCHDTLTDLRLAVADPQLYPWPGNSEEFTPFPEAPFLVALRDLDGDGRAEAVFTIQKPRGDSWRKELKDAKKPIQQYRFHRLNDDLFIEPEPYFSTKVIGHGVEFDAEDEEEVDLPIRIQQFQDLDGDGREDLVTLTFRFSIFQALKILATKRIGIGIDFHVYAHREDGRFVEVPGLDLSEKLKLNLNNLQVGRFAQFAGDFDGDGRQDFTHLGRGKVVTIHAGQPGCRYPKKPDLSIRLDEEPASLSLVRIEDLDGDGRSDLRIARPSPSTDPDVTAPVRLDLYLSGSE